MAVFNGYSAMPEPDEQQVTDGAHILSEIIDDAAPLNERRYRFPAAAMLKYAAYLAALPSVAEAVAWLIPGSGSITTNHQCAMVWQKKFGCTVEPLYASPQSSSQVTERSILGLRTAHISATDMHVIELRLDQEATSRELAYLSSLITENDHAWPATPSAKATCLSTPAPDDRQTPLPITQVTETIEACAARLESFAKARVELAAEYRGQEGSESLIASQMAEAKGFRKAASALRSWALSPAVKGDGWMPIESAPKDGTTILCFFPLDGLADSWCRVVPVFYAENAGSKGWTFASRAASGFSRGYEPTHWRPSPPLPPLPAVGVRYEAEPDIEPARMV